MALFDNSPHGHGQGSALPAFGPVASTKTPQASERLFVPRALDERTAVFCRRCKEQIYPDAGLAATDTKVLLGGGFGADAEEMLEIRMVAHMAARAFKSRKLGYAINTNEEGLPHLRNGIVVWNEDDPAQLVFVRPDRFVVHHCKADPKGRINKVVFGGPLGKQHVELTRLISAHNPINAKSDNPLTNRLESRLDRYLTCLGRSDVSLATLDAEGILDGALNVGMEYEFWAIDPQSGELARIPHKELLWGLLEVDHGKHVDPALAARRMADSHLDILDIYPEYLIVSQSTPPSSSPLKTEVNIHVNSAIGRYVAATLPHLMDGYGPRSDESRQIRDQQARHHGFQHFEDMVNAINQDNIYDEDDRNRHAVAALHAVAAAHLNLGLPHVFFESQGFLIDFEVARNTSNLAFSELGAVARMLTASGPYLTGKAMTVDGLWVRDVREFIRNDAGTALPQNQPIRDAAHFQEIVAWMIMGPHKADRLSRAIVVNTQTDKDGNTVLVPTYHGSGRWRVKRPRDNKDPQTRDGRIEYTGAGATAIRPKIQAMAIFQLLQTLAIIATYERYKRQAAGDSGAKEMDALSLAAELTGTTTDTIWGDAEKAVKDFLLRGPDSSRAHELIERLKTLFTNMFQRYNLAALTDVRDIAMAGLKALKHEGDLQDFADGKGTLGGALIHYARQMDSRGRPKYSGLDIAHMVHAWQQQEAFAISRFTRRRLLRYLKGQRGFRYVPPSTSRHRPTDESDLSVTWDLNVVSDTDLLATGGDLTPIWQ